MFPEVWRRRSSEELKERGLVSPCLALPRPWLVMLQVGLAGRWGFCFCYAPGILLFLFFLKQELLEVCSFFMRSLGCVVQFHRVWLWSGGPVPLTEKMGRKPSSGELRYFLMLTKGVKHQAINHLLSVHLWILVWKTFPLVSHSPESCNYTCGLLIPRFFFSGKSAAKSSRPTRGRS